MQIFKFYFPFFLTKYLACFFSNDIFLFYTFKNKSFIKSTFWSFCHSLLIGIRPKKKRKQKEKKDNSILFLR